MSVGFWSWSRFLAVSLWIINPTVGCHYFPPGPQLPMQPLRGLRPMSLLGEQRHNATSSGNWTVSTTADSPSDANELPVEDWLTILAAASCCRAKLVFLISTRHTQLQAALTHCYQHHRHQLSTEGTRWQEDCWEGCSDHRRYRGRVIDWAVVLCPTWHKIGPFGDVSPNPISWLGKEKTKPKTNTTKNVLQYKHTHRHTFNGPLSKTTQVSPHWKKNKKTKATFSHLLWHSARKRSESILKGKDK